MSIPKQVLSVREKIGYSLGDSSANFVFQFLLYFQTFYFVNIAGISTSAASWLFLVGRLWDAITDPAMGIIADRTRTRWGRFRPWLIWSAFPFAVIFWLTFTAPGWDSAQMKLVYAYVMYLALMTAYTANNVPYSALNGVMTADVNERTSLSTYRFVAAMITANIVQSFTMPLVDKFGGGDQAKGMSITIGLYAIICFAFFFVVFLAVRERVEPDPNQKTSVKTDLRDVLHNRPWVVLFSATLLIFTMLAFRGGSLYYFFTYNIDRGAMLGFLESLGLVLPEGDTASGILNAFGLIVNEGRTNVQSVSFAVFNMAGGLVTVLGVLMAKPLSKAFGKKAVFAVSMFLTALVTAWLFFIPADKPVLLFVQALAWPAVYGPSIPLLWSMIADAADYGEWKTFRRATGLVFAGVVFALKAGLGVGGFLQARVLGAYGFESEIPSQAAEALEGIRLSASIFPSVLILASAVVMLAYPITKHLNYQMAGELDERRRQQGAGA